MPCIRSVAAPVSNSPATVEYLAALSSEVCCFQQECVQALVGAGASLEVLNPQVSGHMPRTGPRRPDPSQPSALMVLRNPWQWKSALLPCSLRCAA